MTPFWPNFFSFVTPFWVPKKLVAISAKEVSFVTLLAAAIIRAAANYHFVIFVTLNCHIRE